MNKPTKVSITEALGNLEYLHNRTPQMSIPGRAAKAFAELSRYRDGAIFVGYYSGDSEWERHSSADEIVIALEGSTTIVLYLHGEEIRYRLLTNELIVVPRNTWHRFADSTKLKVLTVTPQPTDHSLEIP